MDSQATVHPLLLDDSSLAARHSSRWRALTPKPSALKTKPLNLGQLEQQAQEKTIPYQV